MEAIPALKGLNGQKIKDTENVSKTKIRFKQDNTGRHMAVISSPSKASIKLAEEIIHIAINHFYASLEPPVHSYKPDKLNVEAAKYDLETIIFEINLSKA